MTDAAAPIALAKSPSYRITKRRSDNRTAPPQYRHPHGPSSSEGPTAFGQFTIPDRRLYNINRELPIR
jgi:hypothetical protein